ncbi:hypothetical protein OG883_15395 [Streptomyces sp. NBC_01142]|uniref:hypothetical protein n=1 Tax=Streptomyces sp. NBC_01142 TaxID=2975865 RepID=UPI002255BA20|nr:hypothetical protein [Streptomyces sp. NBC_01142]MCX4821269.1 hypothetical protein [Streptomyces sp. NBC_01142]
MVVTVLLAVALLAANQDSSPGTDVSGAPGAPPGATSASRAPESAAPPAAGSVFTIGPGGRGIYQWDGQGAAWTRIGDTAERLWAGPAGLFATGTRDRRLHVYGGRPGVWYPIAEPGRDFAVSGSHVYRLAKDGSAVFVWDGEGTSWTRIGGPAARLYGGGPGLFATDPGDGRIFKYRGRPGDWEYAGTAGAAFALTDRHLYGLTLERDAVNRWLGSRRKETEYRWTRAAGPAGALYGGAAGLFSTDPRGERLRRYDEGAGEWRDIGPAGAEVSVGDREVYRLAANRAAVFRWDRNSGTWRRIGGPAQTLTAALTH